MLTNDTVFEEYEIDAENPVYPFAVKFWDKSDIRCYLNYTDYVVELTSDQFSVETKTSYADGANITLLITPEAGASLIIERDAALAQGVSLPLNGKFPSSQLEIGLDKIVSFCQYLRERLKRTLSLPVGSASPGENIVNELLTAAGDANAAAGSASASAESAADDAESAAASAASAAASAAEAGEIAAGEIGPVIDGKISTHNGSTAAHADKANVSLSNLDATGLAKFNGLADIDLSNLSGDALENLGFGGLQSADGYQVLPGGIIVQWGGGVNRYTGTSGSNQSYTDDFGFEFPNECLAVVICLQSETLTGVNVGAYAVSWTKSGVTWVLDRMDSAITGYAKISYIAIGR